MKRSLGALGGGRPCFSLVVASLSRSPTGRGQWAQLGSYECERDARLSVGSSGRETFREVRSLIEKCMVVRGYSKVPAQP